MSRKNRKARKKNKKIAPTGTGFAEVKPLYGKSQLMALIKEGSVHEAFTDTIYGTFDVTLMRKKAFDEKREAHELSITKENVEWLVNHRDIDPIRVMELTGADLDDPAIAIQVSDNPNDLCFIDGVHRIISAFAEKRNSFKCWIFTMDEAIRPATGWAENLVSWGKFEIVQGKVVPNKPK